MAANEKGAYEPLLAEGRDTIHEVVGESEVPTIEVNDGIAAACAKGVDEPLLAEGRDI